MNITLGQKDLHKHSAHEKKNNTQFGMTRGSDSGLYSTVGIPTLELGPPVQVSTKAEKNTGQLLSSILQSSGKKHYFISLNISRCRSC